MTEREMFKKIFHKIDFELPNSMRDEIWWPCKWDISYDGNYMYRYLSAKEIIFTPEFMVKFIEYLSENEILTSSIEEHNIYYRLMKNNLHDPVTYLYNLLFNK